MTDTATVTLTCPPFDGDKTTWANIPHASHNSRTVARQRMAYVMDADPFVAMLAPATRASMIEGILMALKAGQWHKAEDAIEASSHSSIRGDVERAMRVMPLGFLTEDFKKHLTHLICFAIMPNPERDERHMPV